MRVTNSMMTNSMLINIHRNMGYLDRLYNQIASTKKILAPSDDPITAARALKFRTNVAETLQYQRNVSQGMSWMNVTESAYNNVVDIMSTVKERFNEAATGTLEALDKKTLAAQIRQMVIQMGTEINVSYAGRYVFSGYRTDQPPVLTQTDTALSYTNITQYYSKKDIETTQSYQKLATGNPPGTDEPIVHKISSLKLPYKNVTNLSVTGYGVTEKSVSDNTAYDTSTLGAGDMVYIKETGELIMSAAGAAAFGDDVRITYDKTGFEQGDLNPMVYFTCTDAKGVRYTMDNQGISYEFSVNTQVNVNSLAKNVYTDKMYADLMAICDLLERADVSDEQAVMEKYRLLGYTGDELERLARDQLTAEKANLQAVLHDRLNNMLYLTDRHITNVTKEHTDLGARMNRLDLIQKRLEQDEGTYRQLMSDNEDLDLTTAMMEKTNAEAAYQASLKAGASIMQLTLANFL